MSDNSVHEDYTKSPYEYSTSEYKDLLANWPYSQSDLAKRIVIIGAGMSGLVAGRLLKAAGHSLSILEASNIVGGRVKTLRDRFTSDFYAEAGAMRVPAHHVSS